MWHMPELAGAIARGLAERDRELREEQSPYGLDALDELALHPILRRWLARGTGLGVFSEIPYPSPPAGRSKRRERERCDLVLTEGPDLAIGDPLAEREREEQEASTLFAGALAPPRLAAPEDALWVEVKVVEQFGVISGMAGANHGYSGAFAACREDVAKLAADGRIRFAAVLIVLFTIDEATARHDLNAFAMACLDRGLSIASPEIEGFDIPDRLGNTRCTVALVPVRGAGWDR